MQRQATCFSSLLSGPAPSSFEFTRPQGNVSLKSFSHSSNSSTRPQSLWSPKHPSRLSTCAHHTVTNRRRTSLLNLASDERRTQRWSQGSAACTCRKLREEKATTSAITMCFPSVFKLREEGLRDRQAVRVRIVGYYYISNQEEQEQEL